LFCLTFCWLNYGEWCQHIVRTSCNTCGWWTISKTFFGCKFNSMSTSSWRKMEKSNICIQLDWDGHLCHTHNFLTICTHTLVVYLELEPSIIFYLNKFLWRLLQEWRNLSCCINLEFWGWSLPWATCLVNLLLIYNKVEYLAHTFHFIWEIFAFINILLI